MTAASRQVVAGFIPLLDAAVLIAAREGGFAEREGIGLKLVRETSWANIRDRMAVGHFDVAHMLAPMPIASTLKLTALPVPMRAAMVLGLGGNAITVSTAVAAGMANEGWDGALDPLASGQALASHVRDRATRGQSHLRFGVVHPFSGHAYELRYWLAAAGLDPAVDVEITVVPPRVMPDALANHHLDGYCVGEPWNTVAVDAGAGQFATCKQLIWPNSPEKVLGATEAWANAHPDTLVRLIRALGQAAAWCGDPRNTAALAEILSGAEYLDCRPNECIPALTGRLRVAGDRETHVPGFFQFTGQAGAVPRREHGLWFYSQMLRWGQISYSAEDADRVAAIFDGTMCRDALGVAGPGDDAGRSDVAFFDRRRFDPEAVEDYALSF